MDMKGKKPWYKRLYMIDETVGLHENLSFWFALVLPFLISLLLVGLFSYQLYEEGKHYFVFTQSSITAFIKYFTFPISLLSLSVVFGVMVARFHSSKQRAVSNGVALRNNSVNYFYKTHEEFEKYCKKLVDSEECRLLMLRSDICYGVLFCSSSPENPSLVPCARFFRKVEKIFSIYTNDYIKSIGEVNNNQILTQEEGFNFACPNILMNELGMKLASYGNVDWLNDVNVRLYELYNSVVDLFYFPGMEQRAESTRKLNEIYFKYTGIINENTKHIKLVDLQTPQS